MPSSERDAYFRLPEPQCRRVSTDIFAVICSFDLQMFYIPFSVLFSFHI
jgi:hypothetical protein